MTPADIFNIIVGVWLVGMLIIAALLTIDAILDVQEQKKRPGAPTPPRERGIGGTGPRS